MRQVLVLLMLLAAPASLWGQERAAELEARRQARLATLGQRSVALDWRAASRARAGIGCLGFGGASPYAAGSYAPYGAAGADAALGGATWWGASPYATGYPGVPGSVGRLVGCAPGYYPPYLDPYGFRFLPNPYDDWRAIWGRGWTDDAAVPPYHRFQYRFFPETLPDPTRGGYITPDTWRPAPTRSSPSPARAASCARIRVQTGDGVREALVALPVLGATTAEALRAVLLDRLQRGGGVVVRDLDGYVVRFPPAAAIEELRVSGC